MKTKILLSSLFAASIVLVGCSANNSQESKKEDIEKKIENITNTSQNETKQENTTQKTPVEQSFSKVFDEIKILEQNKANLNTPSDYLDLNLQAVAPEFADGIVKNYDNLDYAAYDINNDGIDELLLGSEYRGERTAYYAFYLNNGTPKQLAQVYAAGAGGFRSSFSIFQDGSIYYTTWGSGNGEGHEAIFKLLANGEALVAVEQNDYKELKSTLLQRNGLTKDLEIDLTKLDWKKISM